MISAMAMTAAVTPNWCPAGAHRLDALVGPTLREQAVTSTMERSRSGREDVPIWNAPAPSLS